VLVAIGTKGELVMSDDHRYARPPLFFDEKGWNWGLTNEI
jgi:hypothetical protein